VYKPDWSAVAAAEVRSIEIPEGERTAFSESHTVRGFYEHDKYGLEAQRRSRVSAGTLAAGTIAKDRQAINRWELYSPRPANWPDGQAWEGRPLAWITDQHVTDFVAAMGKELSAQSAKSTWAHLRTILLHAVRVKALERAPEPTWGKGDGQRAAKQLYDDRQLVAIYTALASQLDLQVAFVVSVNVGQRTVDLFRLRWENFSLQRDRPVVEFTARKTGKRQVIPLGPVTVQQLERWRKATGTLGTSPLVGPGGFCGGLVWPGLTDPNAADPERSRPARDRNARFKIVLAGLGIEHEKPWQVGRLTCNERLERHRPGSGQFVLGHTATLNSTSYREPSGLIYEAVTTLPQPDCFRVDLEGS
jgi:integrase